MKWSFLVIRANLLALSIILFNFYSLNGQCLTNGVFGPGTSCPVVYSLDDCPTWSGSCNGWYISHGTPDLDTITLADKKSYQFGVFMWGASTEGEGMYTDFPFQANTSYDVELAFTSNSTTSGGVYVYAMNGLSPHTLTYCGNGYPSNTGGYQIINYVGNTNYTVDHLTKSFTPTTNYSQLWIYPYGSGSEGPSEYMMNFISIAVCPSCTALIVYNNGAVPTGTSSSGTIEAGSSAGSGGSGTVTIATNEATVFTAAQQIQLEPNFSASPGTGSFVAKIIPCNPNNNIQNYTPPLDSGILVEPESETTGTAITGQASVITDPSAVKLQVYPTVSSGSFTITGGASDLNNADILVTNESGQSVYRLHNSAATTIPVDLTRLGNGMYFIHIANETRSSTMKVIISR